MSFDAVAQETLTILDQGWYKVGSGRVSIAAEQRRAVGSTVLFRPMELADLSRRRLTESRCARPQYSVTQETTQAAARRLVLNEEVKGLAVLNFASARKVGGGFLRGAKSQEEDIARSSGLFRCLETQPEYYQENQACSSSLYTDNIIYSPAVPWFRSEGGSLLEEPFLASVVTAPAPNAKEYLQRGAGDLRVLQETLVRRAAYILEIAASMGNRSLLLGAWGCGVFRNDAQEVAATFMSHLKGRRYRGCFDQVVFAVFDPSKSKETYIAFKSRIK